MKSSAARRLIVVAALGSACTSPRSRSGAVPIPHYRELSGQTRTSGPELVALGRALFFDTRLSANGAISCASCHRPEHGFAEPFPLSHGVGVRSRRRNTPSLINVAAERFLDWDGRAMSLEAQLAGVFSEDGDMGWEIQSAVNAASRDTAYARVCRKLFGTPASPEAVSAALLAFVRTISSNQSGFVRYLFGGDSTAMSAEALRGWVLFQSAKAGCAGCHTPLSPDDGQPKFTDQRFHNLGVGYSDGRMVDVGRQAVSGDAGDYGRFKTPSLRNVALTPPFMHDGSLPSLKHVVEFYASGGIPNPKLDGVMFKRPLSERDKADLVEFLKSLTDPSFENPAVQRKRWYPPR